MPTLEYQIHCLGPTCKGENKLKGVWERYGAVNELAER